MTYIEFLRESPPVLYGQMIMNGRGKIGSFRYGWNNFSNSANYMYYTPEGRKGKGGFTLRRAYELFDSGKLSLNPEHGKVESYL